MHVGDRPYVVTPSGHVDLATRGLTLDAVTGIVSQVLTPEARQAFEEFGATQCDIAPMPELAGEQFTLVVARNGEDVWAEIRRHHVPTAAAFAVYEPRVSSTPSPAAESVHVFEDRKSTRLNSSHRT
mgnify:CR=1 FL=1